MSKIYTKTGDLGETGLVSGKRTSKSDPRIDLYGEIDELNSRLGFAHSLLVEKKTYINECDFLTKIQNALFDLGSNLACEAESRAKYKLPQIKDSLIEEMEKGMDQLEASLPPLKNFILPGGALVASSLHLTRTCARSCERKLVGYYNETHEELPQNSLRFLNRLSDYLFVLARYTNNVEGSAEIPWKPI
jgi:cob(I)alamin adenosyltransferase